MVREFLDVVLLPGATRPMAFGFKTEEIARDLTLDEGRDRDPRPGREFLGNGGMRHPGDESWRKLGRVTGEGLEPSTNGLTYLIGFHRPP